MRRRGRGELTAVVEELLAALPDNGLSHSQWAALTDTMRRVAAALTESEEMYPHFYEVGASRGRPREPALTGWWYRRWPPPLWRYLTRAERAEFAVGLTRALDVRRAFNLLSAWANTHHDALNADTQRTLGVEWPTIAANPTLTGITIRLTRISMRLPRRRQRPEDLNL